MLSTDRASDVCFDEKYLWIGVVMLEPRNLFNFLVHTCDGCVANFFW